MIVNTDSKSFKFTIKSMGIDSPSQSSSSSMIDISGFIQTKQKQNQHNEHYRNEKQRSNHSKKSNNQKINYQQSIEYCFDTEQKLLNNNNSNILNYNFNNNNNNNQRDNTSLESIIFPNHENCNYNNNQNNQNVNDKNDDQPSLSSFTSSSILMSSKSSCIISKNFYKFLIKKNNTNYYNNNYYWNMTLIIISLLYLTSANTFCLCDNLKSIDQQNPLSLLLISSSSPSSSPTLSSTSLANNLDYQNLNDNNNQYFHYHRQHRQYNHQPQQQQQQHSSTFSSSSYPSSRSMMASSTMVITANSNTGQSSSSSHPSASISANAVSYQALPIMHHMYHQNHYDHLKNNDKTVIKANVNHKHHRLPSSMHHHRSNHHHHHQNRHVHPNYHKSHHKHHYEDCVMNTDLILELLFDKMRIHLPDEKINDLNLYSFKTIKKTGAITIFDARITDFAELTRTRQSCAKKLDPDGTSLSIPFEAEIRAAHVAAKLKYNFYVTDIYGDYAANFSHIRLNGTFETNVEDEWMQVSEFNITSSHVIDDSIQFGYVPRWILDWVRSYFDNDNTRMYEHLAKGILQKEADNFNHYDILRKISDQSSSPSSSSSIVSQSSIIESQDEDEQMLPPINLI